MSSQLKKKNKKKKKKNQEDEGGPQKHEREGNLNYYSEEISKEIIEKIISLVISSDFKNKIEYKYNEYNFNFMKKTFDNIIEISHINRDNDYFDADNLEISTFIKTNKSDTDIKRYLLTKHNKAIENRNKIVELNIMKIANISKDFKTYMILKNKKIEDCLNKSTNIEKNKYIKPPKKYQFNINISKKNFWDEIPCPPVSDIDRTSSKFNSYIPRKENHRKSAANTPKNPKKSENKKNKENKNSITKKKSLVSYKNFIAKLSRNFSIFKGINDGQYENILIKKQKAPAIIDMPSYPIENLKVRKENNEILNLRKERMEMIEQLEKEKRKKELIKLKKKQEEEEKAKKIKKGKLTYDNEGNLLLVNEIKQDNLSKEFWPIVSKQKDIQEGKSFDLYKKEKIKMQNEAKKNIIYNDEEYSKYNSYHVKSRMTEPFINFKEIKKSSPMYNQLKIRKKFDDFFFDRFNNKKIEPSGSNFKLINPSVGVKIKEKTLEKSGGNDYYKEFHKHSVDEFNKTLQGNIEWHKYNTKNETQNEQFKTITPNAIPNLKINNLMKKLSDKNENESSSIIDVNKNNNKNYFRRIKRNIINKNKYNNLGKTFSDGFFTSKNKKSILKSSSQIVLENKKMVNLKEILFHDNQDILINKPYNKILKENNSFTNIFIRNKIPTILKQNDKLSDLKKMFSDVDKFNKNIITGKATQEKIYYNNLGMVLPKISKKNEETNFNRTMINFNRERTKKVIWEGFLQKKESMKEIKKIKKINFTKVK